MSLDAIWQTPFALNFLYPGTFLLLVSFVYGLKRRSLRFFWFVLGFTLVVFVGAIISAALHLPWAMPIQ